MGAVGSIFKCATYSQDYYAIQPMRITSWNRIKHILARKCSCIQSTLHIGAAVHILHAACVSSSCYTFRPTTHVHTVVVVVVVVDLTVACTETAHARFAPRDATTIEGAEARVHANAPALTRYHRRIESNDIGWVKWCVCFGIKAIPAAVIDYSLCSTVGAFGTQHYSS